MDQLLVAIARERDRTAAVANRLGSGIIVRPKQCQHPPEQIRFSVAVATEEDVEVERIEIPAQLIVKGGIFEIDMLDRGFAANVLLVKFLGTAFGGAL